MANFARQARREIAAAYRPAERQLSRQERRVRAQDRRMQRDEKAYQSWLRDTNASLNAEAARRDSELAATEKQYHDQLGGNLDAAEAAAGQRSFGPGGAVPPPGAVDANLARAQAGTAQVPGITASESVARAQSAAFGGRLGAQMRRGLGLSQGVEKNTYAQVAVQKAQRRAATMDALSKIAEARGDLAMKKSADAAKRVAELEAAAAEAAQQQFENQLAAERVAISQGQLELGAARLDLSTATAEDMAVDRRVRRRIARQRLGISKDAARRGGRAGGLPPVTRQRQQAAYDNAVEFARSHPGVKGRLKTKGVKRGDTERLANWLLRNTRAELTREMAMAAAYEALGGRLSKQARRTLKRQGIRK